MIDSIIQSNDFEFNKYGVSGESITAIPTVGKSAPADEKPLDLSVNRPFYAFSLKDDFPLFINKVTNLVNKKSYCHRNLKRELKFLKIMTLFFNAIANR